MKRLIKEYESIIWWFGLNERMANKVAKRMYVGEERY